MVKFTVYIEGFEKRTDHCHSLFECLKNIRFHRHIKYIN